MLIYKKNCSKIIKIGTFFLKTYEADAKRVVVSGKDYLRRLQLKHAYLKKNTLLCGFKRTQHTFFRLFTYQIKIQQGNREFK